MRAPAPTIADSIVTRPTTFEVRDHKLIVAKVMERRWTVTVDSRLLDASFDTQADAWEAGVREAHRLDGPPGK
jgi:hypothetical protein